MPHYLTNVQKNEDWLKFIPEAAKRSGQDVRYVDEPMPADYEFGTDYYARIRDSMIGKYGSIVGYANQRDYSKFWSEMRKLQGKTIPGLDD